MIHTCEHHWMKQMSENGTSVSLEDPVLWRHAWLQNLCPCEGWSSMMDCRLLLVSVEQPGCHRYLPKGRKTWFSGQIYWNRIQLFLGKERGAPMKNDNYLSSWLVWPKLDAKDRNKITNCGEYQCATHHQKCLCNISSNSKVFRNDTNLSWTMIKQSTTLMLFFFQFLMN